MASLETIARKILGEERFAELNKWYDKTLEEGFDYVVFVVRRSYILALIMEMITDKKLEDHDSVTFLTDGSVLLHCRNMAKEFTDTGHFPSIMICDDILIHGRNINHLLDAIEARLISLLPGYDPDLIRLELEKAIQINVFKIASGTSLLHGRYAKKLDLSLVTEPKIWRKLSNDISKLILQSGIANASYIYSLNITQQDMDHIKREERLVNTTYHDTEQYSKVWCVQKDSYVKAILTLRFVKSDFGYRMIPFAFIPDLDAAATKNVMQLFAKQLGMDDFDTLMRLYHSYKGMRSYNEFLTLLLSNVILQDMCQKYDIRTDSNDVSHEIRKLARNYNFNTLRQTENCLKTVLGRNMFSLNELMKQLEATIPDDAAVLLDYDAAGDDSPEGVDNDGVYEKLETYFYEKSWREERNAYILKNQPYSPDIDYSRRIVTSVFDVLQDTMDAANALEIYMAYILQMMDAGILAVSSYAPNNQKIDGLMQFAKAGEQSAASYLLKYHAVIPLLAYMQEECEKWNIDLDWEIDTFCAASREMFTTDQIQEWKDLIKNLKSVGQKVSEWNWNDSCDDELKKEYRKYISAI